ncbi:MAG: hypothetical protein WBM17_04520 [Anaerolineales bacterium]
MNRRLRSIEIDRIILDGLDVAPDRAEHIRRLVAAKLGSALSEGEIHDVSTGGSIPHLAAPPLASGAAHDDGGLAGGLAQSIARAIAGSNEGGA